MARMEMKNEQKWSSSDHDKTVLGFETSAERTENMLMNGNPLSVSWRI
jgi:hypothetical protein